MKKTLSLGFFLLIIFNATGQNKTDSIEIKKSFGTVFQQNGKNLRPRKLLEITESNSESNNEMKIAKNYYDVGFVLAFAGGGFVGWPIGTALGGGKPNWSLLGIGAGLILVSIPFSTAYVKHAKNAVGLYNNGLKQSGLNNMGFKIEFACNAIGVKMVF